MANEYDLTTAFEEIENELISSMMRNMARHRAEETEEGIQWSMWQAEQLKALEKYRRDNQSRYSRKFAGLNRQIEDLIRQSRRTGGMKQEIRILQAIRKGFKGQGRNRTAARQMMSAGFFRLNERKLNALIEATTRDMQKAETAVLRMANDKYRKIIYNAQVYANTGAGTYEKAVDMATKDFLSAGLNCIEYANGARHRISDYAEMAIRTASKRAYLQGEGEKRQEWGISTVIINKRRGACPLCAPFVGKVMIDDVWSGGKQSDGRYPLLSSAIAAGLYHPNCKDSHTTYFPGISSAEDTWTKEELQKVGADYLIEQKQANAKRQAERFGRLAKYSLDPENKRMYGAKAEQRKKIANATKPMDVSFRDSTDEWKPVAPEQAKGVIDLKEYVIGGQKYVVDGRHVVLDYKPYEKEIAEIIAKKYGKSVQMVPRVDVPQGIRTPDYVIDGVEYDLKHITKPGNNTIYNRIKEAKGQSNNFIIDLTGNELMDSEVLRQIESVYRSNHTRFVQNLIAMKNGEIKKVFSRNKK